MIHNDFVVISHNNTNVQDIYYLPCWSRDGRPVLEQLSEELNEQIEGEVVEFVNWNLNTLIEVLGNIFEDANQHNRTNDSILILNSMRKAQVSEESIQETFQNLILGFEERYNR